MKTTQSDADARTACEELAQRIETLFARGLLIHQKALRYIDSTLFPGALSKLSDVLADVSHWERQSLLELLFFPDEAALIQLEPLLEKACFKRKDRTLVLKRLMKRNPGVTLVFPDGTPPLALSLPTDAGAVFIKRLEITRHLDPRILKAVETAVRRLQENGEGASGIRTAEAPVGDRIKSMIRHSRAAETERGVDALCTFLSRFPLAAPDFFSCFSFFLDFLETSGEDDDPAASLENQKNLYRKGWEQGIRIRRYLAEHNPETRILSGARFPHVDCEGLMEKIDLIDRIQHRVFISHGGDTIASFETLSGN